MFEDQGPLYLLGDVIDTVGSLLGLDSQTGRIYPSWFFGSVTYTPDDIGEPTLRLAHSHLFGTGGGRVFRPTPALV